MIVINGKILNNSVSNFWCEKVFDERKRESSEGIEKIFVDASIGDVNFFITDLADFDIRLHGKVRITSDIVFRVQRLDNKLKVEVDFKRHIISGNLTLDVAIPKKIYKEIFVSTNCGNINLKEDFEVQTLRAESMSGNVYTRANLKEISINTMNGEVTTVINARNNIFIKLSTMNGNVNVELNNIGCVDISTSTMNGRVTKNGIKDGRYTIEGTISAMNGNINIS